MTRVCPPWRSSALVVSIGLALAVGRLDASLRFQGLTVEDGLSQSHVVAIAEDTGGMVWIGTTWGLNRFDGRSVETFRQGPGALPDDLVLGLHVDGAGVLWVTTPRGIVRRDPGRGTFELVYRAPAVAGVGIWLSSPTTTPDGRLWFVRIRQHAAAEVERALAVLAPDARSLRWVELEGTSDAVTSVVASPDGRVWASAAAPEGRTGAKRRAGLFAFDEESGIFHPVPGAPADCHQADWAEATGSLWAACDDFVVVRYEPATQTWTRWELASGDAPRPREWLTDLTVGADGSLWAIVATAAPGAPDARRNRSIVHVDPEGQLERLEPAPWSDESLGELGLRSVMVDGRGVVWIGTSGGGLRYASTRIRAIESFRHLPREDDSLSHPFVRAVAFEDESRLWVGTPGGLDRIDRVAGRVRHHLHDRAIRRVSSRRPSSPSPSTTAPCGWAARAAA